MLRDLIPARYYNSPEWAALFDAIDPVLEQLQDAAYDLMEQFNVGTATWGLMLWERDYGLLPAVTESHDERRARVRSHMRGAGTTTIDMLRNLTAAYSGGETAVDDLRELFTLSITFIGTVGVPSNMADLKAAVSAARPAHMAIDYKIRYNLWSEVAALTWEKLAGRTWREVKEVAL